MTKEIENNAAKPRMILSADARDNIGGQGLNLHQMIHGLSDDFELFVYCRGADTAQSCAVPQSNLIAMIERIPFIRRSRDWLGLLSQRQFDNYVARHLTKSDLFQGTTGQCAASIQVARAAGTKTVLDVVTTHIDDFAAHQERECQRFGIRPSTNGPMRNRVLEEYRNVPLIRVMSEHAKCTFLERGFDDERLAAVRPYIDIEKFPRAEFNDSVFRIAFVGLIEPWKGFHYLVDAYQKLALPNSELVFWGGTSSRPVAHYFADAMAKNKNIHIQPFAIRDVGLAKVYGAASVLVHPSLTDGFGYVVAEAMACGIPVITTYNTGASELIQTGYNGYLVHAGDTDALADRIQHLAQNPELLPIMGERARRTVALAMTLERFKGSYIPRLMDLMN